jgi:putative uncharacterized protein (fragment)
MSAALDRLKQQNEPEQSQQQLGSPETMELLTSILAAVEAQNTRIATLTEQQKKLAGFVKVMDEETTRRLERIIAAMAKLEARQLWSAAAMCLVLLPVAVVVAGLWMGIAGLIAGVQWVQRVRQPRQLDIGQRLLYSSVHADYCFAPRRHEPARPGHGRPDALPYPDVPA